MLVAGLRDAKTTDVVDVVDGTLDLFDGMSGPVRFCQEVLIDSGARDPVHLVEPAQPKKRLAVSQKEVARSMAEKRRPQDRAVDLICRIFERLPAQSDLIDAELDVISRRTIDRAPSSPW